MAEKTAPSVGSERFCEFLLLGEFDEGDDVNIMQQTSPEEFEFFMQFYNGGTCLEEMLSEELSKFEKTAPIKQKIDELENDYLFMIQVILYTNDIHTYIDAELSYDCLSEIKNELKKQYKYVFLADAGDHIQGTAYGSMDKGESIIKFLNRINIMK